MPGMPAPVTRTAALGSDIEITFSESGTGRPVLILHGGGGPFTVAGIANHLAETMHTITPTHPGWNGTPRPEWFSGIDDLAVAYLQLLEDTDLHSVLVIGSSMGGWIGSEMAVRDGAGRITGLVLIDGVGINVDAQPIRDFFALDARGVAKYAWHDGDGIVTPAYGAAFAQAFQSGRLEVVKDAGHLPQLEQPAATLALIDTYANGQQLLGGGHQEGTGVG